MFFTQENFLFFKIFYLLILLFFFFLIFLKLRKSKDVIRHKKDKVWFLSILFLWLSFFSLFFVFFRPVSTFFWSNILSESWNIVFLLDVSKSMLTEDIAFWESNISRLDASKQFIQKFIVDNPNNMYALTIFSWESVRILPFTQDKNLFITFLSGISEKSLSKNGTNIELWIKGSLDNFINDTNIWTIVLLTDGGEEQLDLNFINSFDFKWKEINFLTLWVWTKKWWYIPLWVDVFGNTQYKIYKWEKVLSTLNDVVINNIWADLKSVVWFIENENDFSKNWELISSQMRSTIIKWNRGESSAEYFFILLGFIFYIISIGVILFNRKNIW